MLAVWLSLALVGVGVGMLVSVAAFYRRRQLYIAPVICVLVLSVIIWFALERVPGANLVWVSGFMIPAGVWTRLWLRKRHPEVQRQREARG